MRIEISSRLLRMSVGLALGDGRFRFVAVSEWSSDQPSTRVPKTIMAAMRRPLHGTEGLSFSWEIEPPMLGENQDDPRFSTRYDQERLTYTLCVERRLWRPIGQDLGSSIQEFLAPLSLGREGVDLGGLGSLLQIQDELQHGRELFLDPDSTLRDYEARIWVNDGRGDLFGVRSMGVVRGLLDLEKSVSRTALV